MKRIIRYAALLLAITVLPAAAQETTAAASAEPVTASSAIAKRYYVAPMFSYLFADEDRKADDGIGGFLAIGKQVGPAFNVEALVSYATYDAEIGGGSEEVTGIGAGVMVFPSKTLSGLFGVASVSYGIGKSDVLTDPDTDEDSTIWDLGLGYLIGPIGFLNDGGIRLEARGRIDEKMQGGRNDFYESVVSAGVLVPIGSPPEVPAAPAEPVAVVPVGAPVDTDGDGVTDDKDRCPGTPQGATVNEFGCEAPACKKPLPGEKVSLAGCGAGEIFVLNGVTFEFDKSTLEPNAKTILDGVSDELKAYPDIKVELSGHTDSRGSDQYNQRLSEARAESVLEYLVTKGVSEDRLTAVGFGESQPVADNNSDEGRELNRRVELKILSGGAAAVSTPVAEATPSATPEASATPATEPAAAASGAGEMPPADAAVIATETAPAADAATAPADAAAPPVGE